MTRSHLGHAERLNAPVSLARASHMSLPDAAELESCFLGHPTRRLVALGDEHLDARYGAFVEALPAYAAKRTRGYPAAAMLRCGAMSDLHRHVLPRTKKDNPDELTTGSVGYHERRAECRTPAPAVDEPA